MCERLAFITLDPGMLGIIPPPEGYLLNSWAIMNKTIISKFWSGCEKGEKDRIAKKGMVGRLHYPQITFGLKKNLNFHVPTR